MVWKFRNIGGGGNSLVVSGYFVFIIQSWYLLWNVFGKAIISTGVLSGTTVCESQ